LMSLNGTVYKYLRAPKRGQVRVHLGPGQGNYLNGWINIDANIFTARCDVWADLRNKLPLHDGTVDALYSHHVIEHLPSLEDHFRDVYRCLKPGGRYRVGGPNGDSAIKKFVANDLTWFGGFPDDRVSIGGRFENFIFCRREHFTILTLSFLEELMAKTGFVDLRVCMPTRETSVPEVFAECLAKEWESDFDTPHTVIVEARKPLSAKN
jgi:SAM-dependent methyltransferase